MAKHGLNTPVADLRAEVEASGQEAGHFATPDKCVEYSQHIDAWIAGNQGITVGQWIAKAVAEKNEASLYGFACIVCTKKMRKLYDDAVIAAMTDAAAQSVQGGIILRKTFGDDLPQHILKAVRHYDHAMKTVERYKAFSEQAE